MCDAGTSADAYALKYIKNEIYICTNIYIVHIPLSVQVLACVLLCPCSLLLPT